MMRIFNSRAGKVRLKALWSVNHFTETIHCHHVSHFSTLQYRKQIDVDCTIIIIFEQILDTTVDFENTMHCRVGCATFVSFRFLRLLAAGFLSMYDLLVDT